MPASCPISLIVGLGNPGNEYVGTRHNMGYDFVDAVADKTGAHFRADAKFFGLVTKAETDKGSVWLLKPTTYMNLSGSAVQAVRSYFKLKPEQILVVHDELDLHPGTMKIKLGGGNAGHNGLKDITEKLGTPNFWRLRFGIGHPRVFCPGMQVADWVLERPTSEHRQAIDDCMTEALKTLDNLVAGNMDRVERAVMKFAHVPKTHSLEEKETQA